MLLYDCGMRRVCDHSRRAELLIQSTPPFTVCEEVGDSRGGWAIAIAGRGGREEEREG